MSIPWAVPGFAFAISNTKEAKLFKVIVGLFKEMTTLPKELWELGVSI